jgi:hypothetical protein
MCFAINDGQEEQLGQDSDSLTESLLVSQQESSSRETM